MLRLRLIGRIPDLSGFGETGDPDGAHHLGAPHSRETCPAEEPVGNSRKLTPGAGGWRP